MAEELQDGIFSGKTTASQSSEERQGAAPSEKKPSAFLQLVKAICYLVAMVGMQNLVAMGLMVVWTVQILADNAAAGVQMAQEEIVVVLTQKLNENMNLVVALYAPLLILFYAVFFKIRKKSLIREAVLRKFPMGFLPALLLIWIGMALSANCGLTLLPKAWLTDYVADSSRMFNASMIPLMLLSNALCAPISEEITIRGLIYSRLKKGFPVWASVLISSLIFGLIHGQVLWTAYTFLLGIVLALVVEQTGSTMAPLLLHILFNLFGTMLPLIGLQMPFLGYLIGAVLGVILLGAGLYLLYRQPKQEMV